MRNSFQTVVCACVVCLIAFGGVRADDTPAGEESPIREWMQAYAGGTVVRLGIDQDALQAEMVEQPVFSYSDVERGIPDATLWVWTREGRPVAFQKVEVNAFRGGKRWTICFVSLSEDLLGVEWAKDPKLEQALQVSSRTYEATVPGVVFEPIPGADPPASAARLRTLQMKRLTDRFQGRMRNPGGDTTEIRILPTPIFEYREMEADSPVGAIFGLSATGTNPDVLLLIEAREHTSEELRWEYAIARMTTAGVILKLDDEDVWDVPGVANRDNVQPNWTFYFMSRQLDVTPK